MQIHGNYQIYRRPLTRFYAIFAKNRKNAKMHKIAKFAENVQKHIKV